MQVDWRSAPSYINYVKLQAYENAPWEYVVKDQKVTAGSNFSTSLINFGQKFNVHKAEIAMSGSQSGENSSIARVVLVDNNPSSMGFGPDANGQADADTSAAMREGGWRKIVSKIIKILWKFMIFDQISSKIDFKFFLGFAPHAGQAGPEMTGDVAMEKDTSDGTFKFFSFFRKPKRHLWSIFKHFFEFDFFF